MTDVLWPELDLFLTMYKGRKLEQKDGRKHVATNNCKEHHDYFGTT